MNQKTSDTSAAISISVKRKRGAQLGNRNAFKHGFYSDQFKQAERINLSLVKNTDLTNEIELLRVQIRRYLEAETASLGQIDYETRLQALRTVSLATECLTRLIRTQALLNVDPLEIENKQKNAKPTSEVID